MSALFTEGQGRLAPICRAVEALHEGDVVNVDGLLWSWRQLLPRCHPGAAHDSVDVAAVVDVLRRHPALAGPLLPGTDDPRAEPRRRQWARVLADACILALERGKLRHGMTASSPALRAAFASAADARATLQSLADSQPIAIAAAAAPTALPGLGFERKEVHIVAGGGSRRLLDLLSPYVRRLRVDLALLGRDQGVVDDDDVYRGLGRLNAREPGCVAERRAHAAEPADDGRVFVIDCARLAEELVDRRARGLLRSLKRSNVVIIGVVDEALWPAVLALRPASVQLLVATSAALAHRPSALLQGAWGGVLPVDGDGPCSLSVPWLGLLPVDVDGDEDAFFGGTQVWRARVDQPTVPVPVVRLVAPANDSVVALQALGFITSGRESK